MFDFRLKVFRTVARRLNFTKAAQELYITQPAVTKHIKEIEKHFEVKLFDRNGTRIKLTEAGAVLLKHTEQVFELHRKAEIELNNLKNLQAGSLRIGASTTIANYIIPLVLPGFKKAYPDIKVTLKIDNTERVEQMLLNKEIDLGITEGYTKSSALEYDEFLEDEIVLVTASREFGEHITKAALKSIPLLLREHGSGTLDVINHALGEKELKTNVYKITMRLSSTESIKLYLLNSECAAFLSIYSVLNELKHNTFRVIDIEKVFMQRYFYWVKLQGEHNSLVDLFMKHASSYNYR
ncbi:transcriptional regulator [Neptunitalea chrysea]|uniref:Transcriptional regulator n=1 Tax=Neptunitalea chrysea TaxID=1647581 RepID=A0A9W6EWE2_9FLAO|nr:LysR substrate-binding domain-containing protein [Neptunitalea chrysea]GLB52823.1 transcriptional regulator [Neptunitalea chrysea]